MFGDATLFLVLTFVVINLAPFALQLILVPCHGIVWGGPRYHCKSALAPQYPYFKPPPSGIFLVHAFNQKIIFTDRDFDFGFSDFVHPYRYMSDILNVVMMMIMMPGFWNVGLG